MSKNALPYTAADVFKLKIKEWIIYHSTIWLMRITGYWKYPRPANGDLEKMTLMDKIYWLYKSSYPITKGRKGAGLERYFEKQNSFQWTLPQDFNITHELTLSAVGDLMSNDYINNSSAVLYKDVSDLIFGADIAMANLECVVLPDSSVNLEFSPRSGPQLYFSKDTFNIVKGYERHQYDFMATACNHTLDFGIQGVDTTLNALKEHKIASNGLNESKEQACSATLMDRNGIKLGLVAHTFGLNAYQPPQDRPWLVNKNDLNEGVLPGGFTQFENQIQYCRENKVDFLIAQLHWGFENESYPTPEQIEFAHHLAELGFDAIIGHHPHVTQPIEYYQTQRDPLRVVPIYYSLGNLINPFSAPHLCLSLVARISLVKGNHAGEQSKTYIRDAGAIPVTQIVENDLKQIRLKPIPKQ